MLGSRRDQQGGGIVKLTISLDLRTQSYLTHTVPAGRSVSDSSPSSLARSMAECLSQMTCVMAVSALATAIAPSFVT